MAAHTLLIGLGGTGSKIVCRVSNLITEEQRRDIAFAVFDTDINELREIREANPFIHTVQTSTKLSVGEYLNIDTHARDSWFPVNSILNSKTLTEGAGQVRAVSRLALDTSIRAGNMEPLHNAIESLYKVESNQTDQALHITIVSSLAGGTGSGLILPVALYTKNYLVTRFQQSANIMRGFFVLPEVFFEVIRGQSERNNLMCNAYATLRELDAFMMKGDGRLDKKYHKSVRLEFPRVGSEMFEEYDVRPYDFCFLFDAQNTEGRKLNDFSQYLDHAANCIYAQSIGPMHKRSNSSEDNTIRDISRQEGRNRYAGAGSSILVYPFEDIREYVALKWQLECLSKDWLKYDVKKTPGARDAGRAVSVDKIYIDGVESGQDVFSKMIRSQCIGIPNADTGEQDNLIDIMMSRMNQFAALYVDNKSREVGRDDVLRTITNIKPDSSIVDAFQSAVRAILNFKQNADRTFGAKSLDRSDGAVELACKNALKDARDIFCIENYLFSIQGEPVFLQPNAIRYVLYKLRQRLSDERSIIDGEYKEAAQYFAERRDDGKPNNKGFYGIFDDKSTPDVERVNDYKVSFSERIANGLGKSSEEQQQKISQLKKSVGKITDIAELTVKKNIVEDGLEYIGKIIKKYEEFYGCFDEKLKLGRRRMNEIVKKYKTTDGKTTRFVCASSNCLDRMADRIMSGGNGFSISPELSARVYLKLRSFAVNENEIVDFDDLFQSVILSHFKSDIMKIYGEQIDLDIIEALEKEAEFELETQDLSEQEQYARDVIASTRKLSTPFVERPMGEQRASISACTYNPSIDPNDDSPKSNLISKELKNYGATPDADIDRHMIMFYQSIYSLRANSLSKFAPEVPGIHAEGSYHKAYYELVDQIAPTLGNARIITPHIDRNWHISYNMPDLDDDDQKRREDRVCLAFVLGLLYRKIRKEDGRNYRLYLDGCYPEEFIVSNRTPCDLFYEVLDALKHNPLVVSRILREIDREMAEELNRNVSFERSALLHNLHALSIVEEVKKAELFRFDAGNMTIFDLPALVKVSAPGDEFTIENGIAMLNVLLDEFYRYMKSMESESVLHEKYAKFVVAQYDQFLHNRLTFRDAKGGSPYYEKAEFMNELYRVPRDRMRVLDELSARDEIDALSDAFKKELDALRKFRGGAQPEPRRLFSTMLERDGYCYGEDENLSQKVGQYDGGHMSGMLMSGDGSRMMNETPSSGNAGARFEERLNSHESVVRDLQSQVEQLTRSMQTLTDLLIAKNSD